MSTSEHITGRNKTDQFYCGYLSDALVIFEDAMRRLVSGVISQCDVSESIDRAHKIKGNAAMYGHPELGRSAANVEPFLRYGNDIGDTENAIIALANLIYKIQDIIASFKPKQQQSETPVSIPVEDLLQTEEIGHISPLDNTDDSSDKKKIVLAYQNGEAFDLIAGLLRAEYEVFQAHTSTDAIEAIEVHKPDLVFIGEILSDTSGLDFAKTIKSISNLKDLLLCLSFSAESSESRFTRIAETISLGIDVFVEEKNALVEMVAFTNSLINAPKQSILIADDDLLVREILDPVLKAAGYKTTMACDGIEALECLANETPDLVILDRFMPRLEGGTVLFEIQNKFSPKSIPVLILTAMDNIGEAKSWFERGASDFISKPFDPDEVLVRVKHHLETRQYAAI